MTTEILVNIESGNGLLPNETNLLLPEPRLTNPYHHLSLSLSSSLSLRPGLLRNFHGKIDVS